MQTKRTRKAGTQRAPYLAEEVFKEPNQGRYYRKARGGRLPTPKQIRLRCDAIRRYLPRPPAGPAGTWDLPIVEDTFYH